MNRPISQLRLLLSSYEKKVNTVFFYCFWWCWPCVRDKQCPGSAGQFTDLTVAYSSFYASANCMHMKNDYLLYLLYFIIYFILVTCLLNLFSDAYRGTNLLWFDQLLHKCSMNSGYLKILLNLKILSDTIPYTFLSSKCKICLQHCVEGTEIV